MPRKANKKTEEKETGAPQVATPNVTAFLDMTEDVGFSAIGSTDTSNVADYLPTFLPSIDLIMGGGIPFKRFSEVYGAEKAGKSTFMLHLTEIASMLGVPTVWIDTEGTTGEDRFNDFNIDKRYVKHFVPEKLGKGNILSIEKVDEIIETMMDKYISNSAMDNVPVLCIWDGVAGTISEEEANTAMEDEGRRGRQASAVTKLVKRVAPKLVNCNMSVVVTNQVRANMDGMAFSKKEKRAANVKALEHAESVRLEIKATKPTKGMTAISRGVVDNGGNNKTGAVVNFTADKSKDGVSSQSTQYEVYSSNVISRDPYINLQGLDFSSCLFTDALGANIIKKAGAYYKFITKNGEVITKHKDELLTEFHENDELLQDLFEQTLVFYFPHRYPAMNNRNIDITKFKYWSDTLTEKYKGVTTGDL